MISVICWKWRRADGSELFSDLYVNRMRSMLERHLHRDHRLFCVTDGGRGSIHPDVEVLGMPSAYRHTPRCRRRMQQYAADIDCQIGYRLLSVDLDMVITDDITPLVERPEPIVMWRVGYANVLSGSFVLWSCGALDGAWQRFAADPDGYPVVAGGPNGSDQAMLNHWIASSGARVAELHDSDGLTPWFGTGYERFAGMSARTPDLLPGTRIVVLGSADKAVLDEGRYDWARTHWR